MQTGNSNINRSQNLITSTAQRLPYSPIAKLHTQISELTKGEILKGEVTNLRGNDIQILLSDGQTLKASFESTLPLYIGDTASFLVEESQRDSLLLKLLPPENSSPTDVTVDKALEEASLPKSDKNIQIVQELLKNGMSIDKKSILNMLRQSATFRNASIETLAIMNRYQIPLTEVNTTQLEAYRNYEFRLIEQAKQLSESITTTLHELPEDSPLREQFSSLFEEITIEPKNTTSNQEVTVPSDTGLLSAQDTGDSGVDATKAALDTTLLHTTEQTLNLDHNEGSPATHLADTERTDSQPSHLHENVESEDMTSAKQLSSQSSESSTQLQQSSSQIVNQDTLLADILKNVFTLPLRKLSEPESISKFYEKLEHDLEEIHSFFEEHSSEIPKEQKDTIFSQSNHMKDNIDFMKTINQLFGYVQLPLKLPNRDVHSELFVYTNKKKLQEGNQQVSVLLHLDMTHLGPIDFHLSLMDQHVTAKISIENPQSLTLVEDHLPELSKALEVKGYRMTYQMEKLEKETKVVRDAFESNTSDLLMRRYSFDLRA